MLKAIIRIFLAMVPFVGLMNCAQEKNSDELIAKKYCSGCHLFPDPLLLDKSTWQEKVLPAMGKLLGADQSDRNPFDEADRIATHQKSSIPGTDWHQIINYYVTNAPGQLPHQSRELITKRTDRFTIEKKVVSDYPDNTFVKIDTLNQCIYTGSMDSSLNVFNQHLNMIGNHRVDGILVDMFFNQKSTTGSREGVITKIGIMQPNDLKTGSADLFTIGKQTFTSKKIIDTLPRPVQSIAADLDADGRTDYLVCGFGNKEGSLIWMHDKGDGRLIKKVLWPLPGAIKAYIDDVNADGLPDIMVLFAQAKEGIYLFLNKGSGVFETKKILDFPPVYGSTYFELVDFNGDGKKDILYTCGDNADYSQVLKYYHGVYLFINEGNFIYKQEYFFPLHGAFKAMSSDFDKDGDLDIAAISYFPDKINQPEEGFVLLEQTGGLKFTPATIKESTKGRWITMDVGDVDSDGDNDIVIGSLYLPNEILQTNENIKRRPLFLLLRNNTVKK